MELYNNINKNIDINDKITFNNTGPFISKKTQKYIILDIDWSEETPTTFKIMLDEPLIISKNSEIFLDSVITNNLKTSDDAGTGKNAAFLLGIDEFNIDTLGGSYSSTSGGYETPTQYRLKNTILIPAYGLHHSIEGNDKSLVHKYNKLNYVSQINPCKITHLNGSITDLDGVSPFNSGNNSRLILEFIIKEI